MARRLIEFFKTTESNIRNCDVNRTFFMNQQVLESLREHLTTKLGDVHFTRVNIIPLPIKKGEKYTATENHWELVFLLEVDLVGRNLKPMPNGPAKVLSRIRMESESLRLLGDRHDTMSNRVWTPRAIEVHFEDCTVENLVSGQIVSMSMVLDGVLTGYVDTKSNGRLAPEVTDMFGGERLRALGLL